MPSINVASFRRGSRDNFFLMGPEVKKTGRQKLLQHKNASTLSQVILFLKLSFDVFECEKNPWTYFLKILYVKNIFFDKISGF